jgi:peptide/nickel transport system substrate-binding protein
MARVLGTTIEVVQADRIEVARAFAREHGVALALKGAHTVIAGPDGHVAINPTGNPGMAKGGSGDVLTGIVGALLARGIEPAAALLNLGNRGQYEFAVNGTAGDFNDPDALTSQLAGGQTASYARSFGYSNPKVDELLDKGRAEFDLEKRKAIYRELETVALADAAFVGLAWRSQGYGLKKSGKGFKNLPGALTFFSGFTLEDLAFG